MLVLGAEKDALIPAFLAQSTAQSYNAPGKIFEGMGHGLMLEKGWKEVAETLHNWHTQNLPPQ